MKKKTGFFITFEGPEGSGKSTQINLLHRALERRGTPALILREPGSTKTGEAIRNILLSRKFMNLDKESELLLYLAARSQLVREKIEPALDKGWVVLCDRFEDSTIAYQGYGRGFSLKTIEALSRFARGRCLPDLTFLLDLSVEEGFRRRKRATDRMESQSLEFHRDVRQGYLELARKNQKRYVVLDARLDKQKIADQIQKRVFHDLG